MENAELHLAEQFALHTNRPLFLTGKAGTGKTTLLRKIAAASSKNIVIVAPTGVAAINAGGVTIHSMFHLPLTSFIPTSDYADLNLVTNRKLLANHLRFSRERVAVLREMELLVMDEASMVRSDILDAVDFVLRTVRRNRQPFGGVQVMLIGDLFQLPPVVREAEWEILQQYYASPFFFDAHVWKELNAVEIELKTIYRQSDEKFLNLLNNIRHRILEEEDYELLKKRFDPLFKPTEPGYVLLTTHNRKADSVNEQELRRLTGKQHTFTAVIEGDFPENMYPCEFELRLKEGAQIMFIRNDAEGKNYYNGKLAVVKKIDAVGIHVTFNDNGNDFTLHRETWENVQYSIEKGTEKIQKKELGSFSQYPVRLAWAITIHKSQGLTFDKVIIDAGQSFAAGQVYVALSRCRSLEGIVLHSLIHPGALHGDDKVSEFTGSHHSAGELSGWLSEAKTEFSRGQLMQLFSFEKLRFKLAEWKEMILEKDLPEKEKVLALYEKLHEQTEALITTAGKFHPQLERLLAASGSMSNEALKERCAKAIAYFTEQLFTQMIQPLHAHIQDFAYKSRVKRYVTFIRELEDFFWNKINKLYNARFADEKLFAGEAHFTREKLKSMPVTSVTSGKKEKGATYKDTLELFRQGKTMDEIAALRSLAASTIKAHIAKWILTGDIDVHEVLPAEKIQRIESFLKRHPSDNFAAIKNELGAAMDYAEVRMVANHIARSKNSVAEKI